MRINKVIQGKVIMMLSNGAIEKQKSANDTPGSKNNRWKMKETMPVCLMLACTFFIYGWLYMYVSNYTSLWFSMKDVILFSLLPAAVLVVICILINRLLPQKAQVYFTAILFGLGIALFVQGTYLNNDYGLLDGATIDWTRYTRRGCISVGVLILAIALPIAIVRIKKEAGGRFLATLSIFVILAELVPLGLQIATNKQLLADEAKKSKEASVLTDEDQFLLSTKQNTIIFCLDAFDCAYMEVLLEADPSYVERFSDFTLFTNTVSAATYTQLAIPAILTDEVYHNDIPYKEYIANSFNESVLLNTLFDSGTEVGIYSLSEHVGESAAIQNQHILKASVVQPARFVACMSGLTAFRFMPQFLKPAFQVTNVSFNPCKGLNKGFSAYRSFDDFAYYKALLEDGLQSTTDAPVFRFYHLQGAHPPFVMNASVERSEASTVKEQVQGSLKIVETYLDILKKNGMYDCTNIVVMADHGYLGLRQHPLFMVKRANENHALTVNDAPVSYSKNLLPTLLSMISIDNVNMEDTVFTVLEDADIERFVITPLDKEKLKQGFLYTLYEFSTRGSAADDSSFEPTGVVYSAGNSNFGIRAKVDSMISKSDLKKETLKGWGGDEANLYSVGGNSILTLRLEELPKHDLILSVNVDMVMLFPGEMELYLGNLFIGKDRASADRDKLEFHIPLSMIPENGALLLNFKPKLPDDISAIDMADLWSFRWDSILIEEAKGDFTDAENVGQGLQLVPRVLENAELQSDNSTVVLHENGVRHGYYMTLPKVKYQLEIRGRQLKDINCFVKSELMDSVVERQRDDNLVRIEFIAKGLMEDCNFIVSNHQPHDVYVSSVTLSKAD